MKRIGTVVCAFVAGSLFATTYYWTANDPGSQKWADAMDLTNWSTAWDGTRNAPATGAHPAALPGASDKLWLCRDILLDLKGQSWTLEPHRNGKYERLGDGNEYYGAANHTFGVTNGTLKLTGTPTFRTAGGVTVEHGGALTLATPILDNGVPVTVKNGGTLTVSILQGNNGSVTVEPGGAMSVSQVALWSYAGARTTSLINRGTLTGASYNSFRLSKQGDGGTINAGCRMVVRQEAGTLVLNGPFNRQGTADTKPDLYAMTYVLQLVGGTVRCQDTVNVVCDEAVVEADASVTLDVADGKTLNMAPFVYGAGAAVTKTGAGTVTFAGNYPATLALAGGTAYLNTASTDPVVTAWSFGAGTVAHLAVKNVQAGTLVVDASARIVPDLTCVNAGDILVACPDAAARTAFAAAVNAGLGENAVLKAVSVDGAVRLVPTAEDRNTITVAAGEDVTWSVWVAEHGAPEPTLTLVKTGAGTLVVDADLSAYTAGLRVEQGTWRGSLPVHFCANNAFVCVTNDGAALEFAATEKNVMYLQTRTIWLRGTGVDGKGVIYDRSTAEQKDWRGLLSGTVVLKGDTLVGTDATAVRKDLGGGGTLDMNGYTLTVRRQNAAHQVAMGKEILNPGHIVFDACTFFCPGGVGTGKMGGSAANTITIRRSGALETWGMTGAECPWTLVWPESGYLKLKTSDAHVWNGPMEIKAGASLLLQGASGASWTLNGPLTGSGTLIFNQHAFTVNLPNEGNAFAGSVTGMAGDTLNYAGHVSGAAQAWSGTGMRLGLAGCAVRTLGDLTFAGAGAVTGGVGRVASVTKTGDGELAWTSYLGGGALILEGGGVALGRLAGLYEGRIAFPESEKAAYNAAFVDGALAATNALVTSLRYASREADWTTYMIATYDGYIWNRTGKDVTWNVHLCFDDRSSLWLDGTRVIEQSGWSKSVEQDIVLTPGYHRITLNALNESGGKGPSDGNGTWLTGAGTGCRTKGFAIKTSPGAGANADAYTVPADDGTGVLFTPAVRPPFESISFAQGTYLDLGGDPLSVGNVTGGGSFRAGDVTVTGTWTVSDVAAPLTVEGALAFAANATLVLDAQAARALSSQGTVLAVATGGVTGLPACSTPGVMVRLSADGTSVVAYGGGLVLTVR